MAFLQMDNLSAAVTRSGLCRDVKVCHESFYSLPQHEVPCFCAQNSCLPAHAQIPAGPLVVC